MLHEVIETVFHLYAGIHAQAAVAGHAKLQQA